MHICRPYIQAYDSAFGSGTTPPLPAISLSNTPKWQLNGSVNYKLPSPVFGGKLSFDLDAHYETDYLTTNVKVPGWTTLNSQIVLDGLDDRPLSVRLFVQNLLNRTYFDGSSSNAASTGLFSLVKAAPRTFGIALRYTFGG